MKINLEAVTGNDFAASLKAKMQSDPPTIFSVGGFQDLKDYGDILEDISDLEVLKLSLIHLSSGGAGLFFPQSV